MSVAPHAPWADGAPFDPSPRAWPDVGRVRKIECGVQVMDATQNTSSRASALGPGQASSPHPWLWADHGQRGLVARRASPYANLATAAATDEMACRRPLGAGREGVVLTCGGWPCLLLLWWWWWWCREAASEGARLQSRCRSAESQFRPLTTKPLSWSPYLAARSSEPHWWAAHAPNLRPRLPSPSVVSCQVLVGPPRASV